MSEIAQIFEAAMVISFGISWPLSIYKSVKSRSIKGKSLLFMIFILAGYAFGITAKLLMGTLTYVFIFYVLNFVMVSIDICLYFRNKRLQQEEPKVVE